MGRSVLSLGRRVSARVQRSPGLAVTCGLIGTGVLAAAVVVALRGYPLSLTIGLPVAALLWALSGYWVPPGSPRTYHRRVRQAWHDWAFEIELSISSHEVEKTRLAPRLADLTPPSRFRAAQSELADHVGAASAAARDPSLGVSRRVQLSANAQREFDAFCARLSREARTEEELAYMSVLNNLGLLSREGREEAALRARRATDALIRELSNRNPPAPRVDARDAAICGLRRYGGSTERIRQAVEAGQVDDAMLASEDLSIAITDLQEAVRDLLT